MEALRSRTKRCNWRPWLDEEIELCASSEDDDQVDEAPKIEIIKDPEEEGGVIDITHIKIPEQSLHQGRDPYISYTLKNPDETTTRVVGSKERKENEEREAKEREERREAKKAEIEKIERETKEQIEANNERNRIDSEKKTKDEEEKLFMMQRLAELEKEKATREQNERIEKAKAERIQRDQLELAQREEEALKFREILTQKSIEQKYKENLVMEKFLGTSLFPNRSFTPPGDDLTMSALGNTMQGIHEEDNQVPDPSLGLAFKERLPVLPYKEGGVSTPRTHTQEYQGFKAKQANRAHMVEDSTTRRLSFP
jgi:hypothetical protein